ncbi:MAG TPA: cytochrome c [Bryobacteraceae bacterium]|nr:cytochrome c [Bryobacteraceae bacterium]
MRKFVKILGAAWAAVALIAGAGVSYLYLHKPAMARASDIRIARTPERLARGAYLFNLADCDGCHSQRDFSRFGGPVAEGGRGAGTVFPDAMGLPGLVAPSNITPDPETGIGAWTDGEKIRAIREGVDRDGRALFPMMPYENFRHMSDEDVYSLVAYLDSLPPVKHKVPKTRLKFPVSMLIKGAPQPAGSVPPPDRSDRRQYGKYLVTLAGCMECHTRQLSGGEVFRVAPNILVVSANISPDRATGIGKWNEQDFVDRFHQYRDYVKNGPPAVGPESFTLMPWLNFCRLPAEDLKAIYAFLHTQPAVYKSVDTHPAWSLQTAGLTSAVKTAAP